MNSQFIDDCQQDMSNPDDEMSAIIMQEIEELLAIEDTLAGFRPAESDAGFKTRRFALIKETAKRLKSDALRNGQKAQAYKRQQRADYAQLVLEAEGREVRSYQKSSPERRKRQKADADKRYRAKQTIAEQSAARQRRRENAKKHELSQALPILQAYIDNAEF